MTGPDSAEKETGRINLDTARLPDPDLAGTLDGRAIAGALNALTSELRLTNLLLAQSMKNAEGSIVYAGQFGLIHDVIRERLLHVTTPDPSVMPTYEGACPSCHEVKFIGHGPLCIDCLRKALTTVTSPAGGDA